MLGLFVVGSYLIWIPREVLIYPSYHISSVPFPELLGAILYIVGAMLFVTGGVLCLMKKCWRVCLASASFAVFVAIFRVVEPSVVLGRFHMHWTAWFVVIGGVISTVLISLSKKEWQEISGSVDFEVSNGG
jgi:hypothetical protein